MNDIDSYIYSFLNGALDAKGKNILSNWINEKEENKIYFKEHVCIWKASAVSSNVNAFDVDRAYSRIESTLLIKKTSQSFIQRYAFGIFSVAAAVVVLCLIKLLLFPIGGNNNLDSTLLTYSVEVPEGAKSKVTFPDGSVVWLNAGSKIEYDSDFSKASRNVKFEGEGYFEIKKNKTLPFIVNTEKLAVKVLGTKFNLKSYKEDKSVKVALKEGSVKIEKFQNGNRSVLLKPNQQFTYSKHDNSVMINRIEANYIDAWRNGMMFFDNIALSDIALQLERVYDVRVVIQGKGLDNIVYYSNFRDDQPLEDVLQILSAGNKFKYEINKDNIRIFN